MSDIEAGLGLLRDAMERAGKSRMFNRAKAIVGVPADATQAERQALLAAVRDAGISKARLFDEPLMAAIGAGLLIDEPRGRMLIDCGAGTTEVAIRSEEHTSELQSLMRISYAVFRLKKKNKET